MRLVDADLVLEWLWSNILPSGATRPSYSTNIDAFDVVYAIETVFPMYEWVPADDIRSLPEPTVDVLVIDKHGEMHVAYLMYAEGSKRPLWYISTDDGWSSTRIPDIIAWMSLPKPYERG